MGWVAKIPTVLWGPPPAHTHTHPESKTMAGKCRYPLRDTRVQVSKQASLGWVPSNRTNADQAGMPGPSSAWMNDTSRCPKRDPAPCGEGEGSFKAARALAKGAWVMAQCATERQPPAEHGVLKSVVSRKILQSGPGGGEAQVSRERGRGSPAQVDRGRRLGTEGGASLHRQGPCSGAPLLSHEESRYSPLHNPWMAGHNKHNTVQASGWWSPSFLFCSVPCLPPPPQFKPRALSGNQSW